MNFIGLAIACVGMSIVGLAEGLISRLLFVRL